MTEDRFDIVSPLRCMLGEGPVWDAGSQRIYWIDIIKGEIHLFDPLSKTTRTCRIQQPVGSIALRANGGMIGALESGFAFIDFDREILEEIVDPEQKMPNNRFNDGKCDPAGRFWAGTMNLDEKSPTGNLYMLDMDLTATLKITDVKISNGMAWDTSSDTFYYIDSPTSKVMAYDFNLWTGEISRKRAVIHIPGHMGYPDGMTIDEEGMLWIAFFEGWGVCRWNPHNGKLLERIKLPVSKVTSCCFGGRLLNEFYITTAKVHLNDSQLKEQPLAGALFVISDFGFRGRPAHTFGG